MKIEEQNLSSLLYLLLCVGYQNIGADQIFCRMRAAESSVCS